MLLALLATAAGSRAAACQSVPVPTAETAVGARERVCFFGSEAAFEAAYHEAARATGCRTIDEDPPRCDCPTTPLDPAACRSWGVNLFRLYSPEFGAEAQAVADLVGRTSRACDTYSGLVLSEPEAVGLEEDRIVPACQRQQTTRPPDQAIYTVYIVAVSLEVSFLLFEFIRDRTLLTEIKRA
jgi:hypothetical protein